VIVIPFVTSACANFYLVIIPLAVIVPVAIICIRILAVIQLVLRFLVLTRSAPISFELGLAVCRLNFGYAAVFGLAVIRRLVRLPVVMV
jgi:hypothetical protein